MCFVCDIVLVKLLLGLFKCDFILFGVIRQVGFNIFVGCNVLVWSVLTTAWMRTLSGLKQLQETNSTCFNSVNTPAIVCNSAGQHYAKGLLFSQLLFVKLSLHPPPQPSRVPMCGKSTVDCQSEGLDPPPPFFTGNSRPGDFEHPPPHAHFHR